MRNKVVISILVVLSSTSAFAGKVENYRSTYSLLRNSTDAQDTGALADAQKTFDNAVPIELDRRVIYNKVRSQQLESQLSAEMEVFKSSIHVPQHLLHDDIASKKILIDNIQINQRRASYLRLELIAAESRFRHELEKIKLNLDISKAKMVHAVSHDKANAIATQVSKLPDDEATALLSHIHDNYQRSSEAERMAIFEQLLTFRNESNINLSTYFKILPSTQKCLGAKKGGEFAIKVSGMMSDIKAALEYPAAVTLMEEFHQLTGEACHNSVVEFLGLSTLGVNTRENKDVAVGSSRNSTPAFAVGGISSVRAN